MYAAIIITFLTVAAAFPSSNPQECIDEIQRRYNEYVDLTPGQAHDRAAIMQRVLNNIDPNKCEDVQFKMDIPDEEQDNGNISNNQQRIATEHDQRTRNIDRSQERYLPNYPGNQFDNRNINYPNFDQPVPHDKRFTNYQNFRQPYFPQSGPFNHLPYRQADNLYNRPPSYGTYGQPIYSQGNPNDYYNPRRVNWPFGRTPYNYHDIRRTNDGPIPPEHYLNRGYPREIPYWSDNPNYGYKDFRGQQIHPQNIKNNAPRNTHQSFANSTAISETKTKAGPHNKPKVIPKNKNITGASKNITSVPKQIIGPVKSLIPKDIKKPVDNITSEAIKPVGDVLGKDIEEDVDDILEVTIETSTWSTTYPSTYSYSTTEASEPDETTTTTTSKQNEDTTTTEKNKMESSTPKNSEKDDNSNSSSTQKPNNEGQNNDLGNDKAVNNDQGNNDQGNNKPVNNDQGNNKPVNNDQGNNDQGNNIQGYNIQGYNSQEYFNQIGNSVAQNESYSSPQWCQIDFIAVFVNAFNTLKQWFDAAMLACRSYFGVST